MHLQRKALISVAGVAVIALAISVVGPRAVRAFASPTPAFSPTAVRYPFSCTAFFDGEGNPSLTKSCTGDLVQLPPGVEFVIQTINRAFSTSANNVLINVSLYTGGNPDSWSEYVTPEKGTGGFFGSSQTTLYSDPSTVLQVTLAPSQKAIIDGTVTLVGYYVYPPVS